MFSKIAAIAIAACIAGCALNTPANQPVSLAAISAAPAIRVVDGDTLVIGATTIRLLGIDAPEAKQPHGAIATAALRKIVTDAKSLECQSKKADRYGRSLGSCIADGKDVGGLLVDGGHAWAYRAYSKIYVPAEDRAHAAKLGLWASPAVAPWDWRRGVRVAAQ